MGADSAKGREEEARKLLRWGQQNFTTVQILHRGKKVGTERIWYGDKENIALGTEQMCIRDRCRSGPNEWH